MMLFEEVLRRLTPTERRVVEYFVSNGGSAREIAGALGISERTVYKALYRYRRIAESMGYDASEFYFRRRRGGDASIVHARTVSNNSDGCDKEVVRLLRMILAELEKINAKLDAMSRYSRSAASKVEARGGEPTLSDNEGEELPSFASGNPWLRVLSGRR